MPGSWQTAQRRPASIECSHVTVEFSKPQGRGIRAGRGRFHVFQVPRNEIGESRTSEDGLPTPDVLAQDDVPTLFLRSLSLEH